LGVIRVNAVFPGFTFTDLNNFKARATRKRPRRWDEIEIGAAFRESPVFHLRDDQAFPAPRDKRTARQV
jgi:hypothetical protein